MLYTVSNISTGHCVDTFVHLLHVPILVPMKSITHQEGD